VRAGADSGARTSITSTIDPAAEQPGGEAADHRGARADQQQQREDPASLAVVGRET
jgi:hypothetical protein